MSARSVLLGVVVSGMAGCDSGTPPNGSRAIVAADHLEQQQSKIERIRASLKSGPSAKPVVRR
jgi:hypothetical protein